MPKQISMGTCNFCHKEVSRATMTKHLTSCAQRKEMQGKAADLKKVKKTKVLHLFVQGRYSPTYWMHIDVDANDTLQTLDGFLRDIWLECCGHLSAFRINGVEYSVAEALYEWETAGKRMNVRLNRVLQPGQTFDYEYDFGSTTELTLKVMSEREAIVPEQEIEVLAQNNPPQFVCEECGKPATNICSECIYEDKGYVCEKCGKDHKCGEEMLLPIVNSPRVGVCAYEG